MYQPPALYLITQRDATAGRPLVDVIAQALAAAEPFRRADGRLPVAVCLREKDLAGADLLALARKVGAVARAAAADFFVNTRVDVAIAAGADGVHLPVLGIPPAAVRAVAPYLRVGLSTHTSGEVAEAAQAAVDFVVFGPVFATPSKSGILSARGITELSAVARLGIPVLALGGITPEVTEACRNAGAAGVACIRAVLATANPGAETVSFLARFQGQSRNR